MPPHRHGFGDAHCGPPGHGAGHDAPLSGYALVSLGCLLAAVATTGPHHEADSAAATHPAGAAASLDCTVDATTHDGVDLRLTNSSADRLPAGTRWAWSSSGTPGPVGEVRVLPQALARADSLVLHSDLPSRGLGCIARVLHDEHWFDR